MDVCSVIKQRLAELKLDQKDLAVAAGVTDSYISQLLTRTKLPPAPERTDLYAKIGKLLKLPAAKLSDLAEHERAEELKKKLPGSPVPLYREVRAMVLRKCVAERQKELRAIFERHPFGELERLVTQKLLDTAKRVARKELESDSWLKLVARLNGRKFEEMRVSILEFLDTDVMNISVENCISFLDPLIESWEIDLTHFGIQIVLNQRLAPENLKKVEYMEREPGVSPEDEPGFGEFLRNSAMSKDISGEEIEFLKRLRFTAARPTALYYYRQLQSLRDPLHFHRASVAPMHKYGDAIGIERQMQVHARHRALSRWQLGNPKRAKKRRRKSRSASGTGRPG